MVHAILAAMPLPQAIAVSFGTTVALSSVWLGIQKALTKGNKPSTITSTWAEATVAYRKFQNSDPIKQIKL